MTKGVAWGFLWGLGLWILNLGFRTEGSESEFRVKALGFKVKVLGHSGPCYLVGVSNKQGSLVWGFLEYGL